VVPADGEIFAIDIVERCEALIQTGIWAGLDVLRLRSWLSNFHTPEERFFAACVLDALIFRSEKQTLALMQHLLTKSLVSVLSAQAAGHSSGGNLIRSLRHPSTARTLRFVPVIRDDDPPTKSGIVLARMYRRHFGVRDELFTWPWRIGTRGEKRRVYVFLDDFLGTGTQFLKFAARFRLRERLAASVAVYAPLVAHQKGLSALSASWPQLHVCPVELLTDRHSMFAAKSPWFEDGVNTPVGAEQFYNELLDRRGLVPRKPSRRTGYGALGLVYGFDHGTPNNCLPILWRRTSSWHPLLER
jgi:hypothetical protein